MLAAVLLAMSLFAAIWDWYDEVRHLFETGNPSISMEALTAVLMLAIVFAVFTGCTYAEFFGGRRSLRLVPILLVPIVLLSLFGMRGLYLNISNGDLISSLRGPRGPTTTMTLLFIPLALIYFGVTMVRRRDLNIGESDDARESPS